MDLNIHDFAEVINFNIDNGIKRSILGLGPSGIGKSAIAYDIAQSRNMGFIDLRLLLFTETELKGIPFPSEDNLHTMWLHNDILPREDRDGERGILLIEEITSASKRVQAAAYQLIHDRKLGSYTLPDGWYIVALGNRLDDNGVYTEMPAPLANRFEIHNISYDLDQWKRDFAYPNKINEAVIAYLNFKPVALHNFDPEGESLRFASPRTWAAVSDIMNTGKLDIGSKLLRAKIEANIGETEAASFLAFLKEREAVDVVDQIMDGTYKEVPERDDIKYILISSLVYKLTEAGLPKDKFVNVINYMLLMDAEFTALAIEDLKAANSPTEINRLLLMEVDSPELELFISNNKALLE